MAPKTTAIAILPSYAGQVYSPPTRPSWLSPPANNQNIQQPQDASIGLMDVVLHTGVAASTGAVLAFLDSSLKDGLDYRDVPLDLSAATILQGTAYFLNSPLALSAGDSAMAIYGFRFTKKLLGQVSKKTSTVAGEPVVTASKPEEDEIVSVGKALDED